MTVTTDGDDAALPPLVFVAGMGRSGSTLVSRLFEASGHAVAVGELMRVGKREHLCSCGRPGRDCPMWGPVLAELGPRIERLGAVEDRINTKRLLAWILWPRPWTLRLSGRAGLVRDYAAVLDAALDLLGVHTAAHTDDATLVDKSLSPFYLAVLTGLTRHRPAIVHLVRDPRSVAVSLGRTKLDAATGRPMFRARAGWVARHWVSRHLLTEIQLRRASRVTRLRYEDLTVAPGPTMTGLRSDLGMAPPPPGWDDPGPATRSAEPAVGFRVAVPTTHQLEANPTRHDRAEAVTVRRDETWRRELTRRDRLVVEAVTWPLRRRYGYTAEHGVDRNGDHGGATLVDRLRPVAGRARARWERRGPGRPGGDGQGRSRGRGRAGWEQRYAELEDPATLGWHTEGAPPELARLLADWTGSTGRALDLGAGPGRATAALAERFDVVVGLDIATSAFAHAARVVSPADRRFVVAAAPRLPLAAGSLDLVHDRGCMHCLEPASWAAHLAEIARVLAPGGTAQLVEHTITADDLAERLPAGLVIDEVAPFVMTFPDGTTRDMIDARLRRPR